MKIKITILISLLCMYSNINILNKIKNQKLEKKKNPDDEELGPPTKGDSIGTNLYNSQVVTKALIRPQDWFFNVVLTRPSTKYFREAESNGLHYQIDRITNELETDYRRNMDELYDQKLQIYEKKLENGSKIKQNVMPETFSLHHGTKNPIYQPMFLELNQENFMKSSEIEIENLKHPFNIDNGPLDIDTDLIDNMNFLEDLKKFKIKIDGLKLKSHLDNKNSTQIERKKTKIDNDSVTFLSVGPKINSLKNNKGQYFSSMFKSVDNKIDFKMLNVGYYGKSKIN